MENRKCVLHINFFHRTLEHATIIDLNIKEGKLHFIEVGLKSTVSLTN